MCWEKYTGMCEEITSFCYGGSVGEGEEGGKCGEGGGEGVGEGVEEGVGDEGGKGGEGGWRRRRRIFADFHFGKIIKKNVD